MLSLEHELHVELFRRRPELAPELLRACTAIRLEGATTERGSIDLSQVAPTGYHADALTVLRGSDGAAVAAVIAEVQLHRDDDKRWTWPLYVAAARASHRCPVTLLVLAPDPAVARWGSQPIELGHPGFVLRPVVLGYAEIPRVRDPAAARAAPQLAVLSAIAHPELETATAARAALDELPEEDRKLYWGIILSRLPPHVRQSLEPTMIKMKINTDEPMGEFARTFVAQGREMGFLRAIATLVEARTPGLGDEALDRLYGQPEARLVQILLELDKVHDEDGVRALLARHAWTNVNDAAR
ncbi:MAG TPA: hypothetical protein VNO30_12675 [Kofleriaceae bacterium]|nr:hypothetical protein [Kofleriaceae bacterium]